MGEVVNVVPKTRKINYKKKVITIKYLVKENLWHWSFVVSSKLEGKATTFAKAEKEAKELLDKVVPIR